MPPEASYPATVIVRPSRWAHVSASAWDSSGSAPGSPRDLADEQLHQARFDEQPGPSCRALDRRLAGPSSSIALSRYRPRSTSRANAGCAETLAQAIGPQRHDQRAGTLGEGGEEPGPLVRVGAQRDRLLALIDDEDARRVLERRRGRRQRTHRVGARA